MIYPIDSTFAAARALGTGSAIKARPAVSSDVGAATAGLPASSTPPSNTGVNKPRHTREEALILEGGQVKVLCAERAQLNASGVIVDYLRVTVRKDALLTLPDVKSDDDESLVHVLAFRVACALGFELGEARPGRDYYDFTWTIVNAFDKEVASVSGGGATQRDTFCVTVKGEACTFAERGWETRLHELLAPLAPRVTRIDLARDFLDGECTIDEVVHCYNAGEFDYLNRRPSHQEHGVWIGQTQHSRTFQVGQRESGKLMRAYEKGHQFKLMNDAWLRVEVELRNVNRVIPFDALIRPADFFAGAYNFCQMVLETKATPERVRTSTKTGEASVQRLMNWFERTVAPTLVHISAAAPDQSWLDEIIGHHIKRKAPRSIAGLNHRALLDGVSNYLQKFSEPVPAGIAPF